MIHCHPTSISSSTPYQQQRYSSLPQHVTTNASSQNHLNCGSNPQAFEGRSHTDYWDGHLIHSTESFRPINLPPKNPKELAAQIRTVGELELRYRGRLQQLAVDKALQHLRQAQRNFRLTSLNQLWLTRLLPELVQRIAAGEPVGAEIEKVWRQGLPNNIRRVVWPLAVGNSLRITPELFEIAAQKAFELRAFKQLSGISDSFDKRKRSKKRKIESTTHSSSSSSQEIFVANDLSDQSSCNFQSSSEESQPEFRSARKPLISYESDPDEENVQERIIRASLDEILKSRNRIITNRESSLVCISPDIPRTFPSLKLFQNDSVEGPLHFACQKLLEGWVCYRPDVGYVQGMSFLAALLLVYLDQFPAFVCFCNLLSSPSLLGLYRMEPELITKRFKIFDRLFEKENPQLFRFFQEISFPHEMYLLEWFLTLYAKSLSLEMASYVWDILLLDGEITLYVAGVAILNIVSQNILIKRSKNNSRSSHNWLSLHRNSNYKSLRNVQDEVDDEKEDEDEVELHQAFDATRRVLANLKRYVTDEGQLLDFMMAIKSRIPIDIIRDVQMIASVEFSAVADCRHDTIDYGTDRTLD